MDIDRKALTEIISKGIKSSRRGYLIPDNLIARFLDLYTTHCLKNKWLKTDLIAQWLKGENDFPPEEIAILFKDLKEKVRDTLGVEMLMPGEPLPPEVATPPPMPAPKINKADVKTPKKDESWGGEWRGESDEDGDKLSPVSEEKDDRLEIVEEAPINKPKVDIPFDPRQFAPIIMLKEAGLSGTTFVGVVDEAYWMAQNKDEKRLRCRKLFIKVKSSRIRDLQVFSANGSLLAQTSGDELRIIR